MSNVIDVYWKLS